MCIYLYIIPLYHVKPQLFKDSTKKSELLFRLWFMAKLEYEKDIIALVRSLSSPVLVSYVTVSPKLCYNFAIL